MRVKNHVARRIRRDWVLALVWQVSPSHLRCVTMTVVLIAVGVRMDTPCRHACQQHRNHQQQRSQLADGALDPEVHAAVEYSKCHF